jgi:N-acetyl-anhydromuramyl-L-alanine amidase AmpD
MNIIKPVLPWRYPLSPLDPDNVKYIVIHHIEASTAAIEDIDSWHKQNGWNGVGYNYYVRKDGTVYEGRGMNIGAHCLNYNEMSIGIACEGSYMTEIPPDVQIDALVELIKELKPQFLNLIEIGPHKKYCSTSCPGRNFPFDAVIEKVKQEMPQEQIQSTDPQPYVIDLCNQGINMQMFSDHLEIRIGNGPWKVINFD